MWTRKQKTVMTSSPRMAIAAATLGMARGASCTTAIQKIPSPMQQTVDISRVHMKPE